MFFKFRSFATMAILLILLSPLMLFSADKSIVAAAENHDELMRADENSNATGKCAWQTYAYSKIYFRDRLHSWRCVLQ